MEKFQKQVKSLVKVLTSFGLLLFVCIGTLFYFKGHPTIFKSDTAYENLKKEKTAFIELDSITIAKSGFVHDVGVSQVIQNCTQCHSAKLVTQNHMTAAGWENTIIWMQETQNLWDLGANQERIISYLGKNYGPKGKGRRQNLTDVAWYELK